MSKHSRSLEITLFDVLKLEAYVTYNSGSIPMFTV